MMHASASGYHPCGCRDCFEIAIGEPGEFCWECEEAGCEEGEECSSPNAYGIGEAFNDPRVPCCGRDAADCDCPSECSWCASSSLAVEDTGGGVLLCQPCEESPEGRDGLYGLSAATGVDRTGGAS